MILRWLCMTPLLFACDIARGEDGDAVPLRIFDFQPVSEDLNPAVARIDGSTVIPLSELRGFVAAERASLIDDSLDRAEWREVLDDLIDEYLLVLEARRMEVHRGERFRKRMEFTRGMLLSEFLVSAEVDAMASSGDEYTRLLNQLREDLFEGCHIEVSNEVHQALAEAAGVAIELIPATLKTQEDLDRGARAFEAAMAAIGDLELARYNGQPLPARRMLAFYLALPAGDRVAIDTPQGLTRLLKELLMTELMQAEALRLKLDRQYAFKAKMLENEVSLLRMYMRDYLGITPGIGRDAVDEAELLAWYRARRSDYPPVLTDEALENPDEYEGNRERVLDDFLEARASRDRREFVDELRIRHVVEIYEQALIQAIGVGASGQ